MRNMLKVLLLVCGLFFSLALCSNAQAAAITWTWDTTGQLEKTAYVQTNAATTINWGDGTTESIATSTSGVTLTHTYGSTTNYTVTIANDVVCELQLCQLKINKLDVTNAKSLARLHCNSNQLTNLDVSKNTELVYLFCDDNNFTNLDVSKNTKLMQLGCTGLNLTSLDLSNNKALTTLWCQVNQLTGLDLSANSALTYLNCGVNKLRELDLSRNTLLTTLYCIDNQLTELDLSTNTALIELYCGNNQLTRLDVSTNSALNKLCCVQSTMINLYVNATQMSNMTITGTSSACYDITSDKTVHKYKTTSVSLSPTIWWIWDTLGQLTKSVTVKTSASTTIDWGDGTVDTVAVSSNALTLAHTYTTAGSYRVDITDNVVWSLNCSASQISILNISKATVLRAIKCNNNQLVNLDVSRNTELTYLACTTNQLSSLDVTANIALDTLGCAENLLTTLNVSQNTKLTYLACHMNQLNDLNLSKNTLLNHLNCGKNPFGSLDLSANTKLIALYCRDNQLTTLNLETNTLLTDLYCGNNELISLDISNNTALSKVCVTQPTLTNLIINSNQSANMIIENQEESCWEITTDNTIHKHINTCIGTSPHIGGTHENGGVCENCQGVYQIHGQSITVSSYTQQESGHIPVYSCTQDGCTVTYTGTEEAHTGSISCELCGWISENYDGSYTLTITYEGDVTTREVEVNRVVTFGLGDRSDAQYTVATENTVLRVYGNRRQFVMPAGNVEITIQN